MKTSENRREAIRDLVRSKHVRRQSEIVYALINMGIECTQGTVSRDISEMGLGKDSSGRYLLNEDLLLRRMLSDFSLSMTCALNMVVIKTTSGTAQGVAAALDNAELSEVVGTIAGDDTIFIATANEEQAKNLVNVLKMWR